MLLMVMLEVGLVIGRTNSTPKYIILAETGMMGLFRNLSVSTKHPHMALFSSRDYPVCASYGYLLVLLLEMVRWVWGPGTKNFTYQKFDCWIDGDNFALSRSIEYSSMSNYYKTGTIVHK